MSFDDTVAYCNHRAGSYPVTVSSRAENHWIKNKLRARKSHNSFWNGITDLKTEGQFRYQHNGNDATYFDWAGDQPDNLIGGNEDCVVFMRDDGYQWHDVPCADRLYLPICELRLKNQSAIIG